MSDPTPLSLVSPQGGAAPTMSRDARADAATTVFNRLDHLIDIGAALSSERRLDALLERIVLAAKTITRADGGTLYLVEGEGEARRLRFEIVRTQSLGLAMGGTTGSPVPFQPIPLYVDGRPNLAMIAARATLTHSIVNIVDAYRATGFDFSGTRRFDQQTGYRSVSFLTVPMVGHDNDVIGVLQLINCLDPATGEITGFDLAGMKMARSLASQAAVALENRQLIIQLEHLFESFIELINNAIDEKSPYTGGHCQRVPALTMMLAEAVHGTRDGPLAGFQMTDADRHELRIASLLHDCGKVTTPVHIVDKATKLEAIFDRIHLVDTRFEVLRRDVELDALRAKLEVARNALLGPGELAEADALIERRQRERLARLESDRLFLRRANMGVESMPESDRERIKRIAEGYRWTDPGGAVAPFLDEDEVKNLTVKSGTLTGAERQIINQHIHSTIKMLESLPWPKHLRNVPEYAGGHHERMDGKGYPRGLTGEQMSVQARIMAIADIFEALTARDRPYKKGKLLSEAMQILGRFSMNGHVDPDLFRVFVREKIYLQYAREFMDPWQVDEVDEWGIPGYRA